MALSTDSASSPSGRRRVDSAVNMIPFIDLLVCCIAFLIITAVWTQLERLDVRQSSGPPSLDPITPPPSLVLRMGEAGLTIVDETGAAVVVPRDGGHHDVARLGRELGLLRHLTPVGTRLVVAPDDGQRYEEIVAVMDAALGARFPELTVSSE